MSNWDDIAFSGECGRINPATEPDVIRPDHPCPEMTNDGVPLEHNTMSIEQCIGRLKEKNKCTKRCKIIHDHLESKNKKLKRRRKLDARHNNVLKRKLRQKRSVL